MDAKRQIAGLIALADLRASTAQKCVCGADEDVCSNTEQEKPLAIDDDEEEDEISDLLI